MFKNSVGTTRALIAAGMIAGAFATAATAYSMQGTEPVPAEQKLEERALTDAEHLRITDARQRLIKRCMNRKGFKFWEAERLSLEESRTIGYATDDIDWARKHGYGSRIEAKVDRARRTNPNLAYRKSLSAERRTAYDVALDGGLRAPVISADLPGGGTVRKRVGGCVAEAEQHLYGDLETWFRAEKISHNLRPLYVPQVMRDKKFTAALKDWSRCMERAGHPYPDPPAARQAARERARELPPDQAFEAERRLAVADAVCTRETSLRAIGNEREDHYLHKLRNRYGEAIDTDRRIQRKAFERARKIVGPRT